MAKVLGVTPLIMCHRKRLHVSRLERETPPLAMEKQATMLREHHMAKNAGSLEELTQLPATSQQENKDLIVQMQGNKFYQLLRDLGWNRIPPASLASDETTAPVNTWIAA